MVVDAFTYNNEKELLEIRLNILGDFVDRFVILEATETFSGKSKPLYYGKGKETFKKWEHKIQYYVLDDWNHEEVWDMARNSPNTEYGNGAQHWLREFYIKEHIKDALEGLNDDDIVFVGDVDEIWNPDQLREILQSPVKLKLKVYSYYLNNRSTEEFWGTIVCQYRDIKDRCLNHLRTSILPKSEQEYGWHFTSMTNVRQKLTDSYTSDSYANNQVLDNLEENIKNNKDFLGRDFQYKTDETEWPDYLKENKIHYKTLLR